LRGQKPELRDFRNILIPDLNLPVFIQKTVGAFQIPMDNIMVVKAINAIEHLYKKFPDFFLGYRLASLSHVSNFS
jgi:hypothetical protein